MVVFEIDYCTDYCHVNVTAKSLGSRKWCTPTQSCHAISILGFHVVGAERNCGLDSKWQPNIDEDVSCSWPRWLSVVWILIINIYCRTWAWVARWCHLLSNKPDTRVVLVFSDREAEFMRPGDRTACSRQFLKFAMLYDLVVPSRIRNSKHNILWLINCNIVSLSGDMMQPLIHH